MNRKIIKIFKLKYIYNTDSPNNSQKYTKNILYYIYLITFIVKKLFKKIIEENIKYKEKR